MSQLYYRVRVRVVVFNATFKQPTLQMEDVLVATCSDDGTVRLWQPLQVDDCRVGDHMVVGFTTTCAVSAYHH